MKLFNIFCILCLTAFAFSSCGKHEVIEPEVEMTIEDLSSARMVSDIIIPIDQSHDMGEAGTIDKGGNDNTAEICLVDFSIANPTSGGNNGKSKVVTKP